MKRKTSQISTIFYFLFFFVLSTSFAQVVSKTNDYFNLKNRLKFGNYLFCQQDYLRAIDEFNAVNKKIKNDTLDFKIGYAFEKMRKYDKAIEKFSELNGNKNLSGLSRLETGKIFLLKKEFPEVYKLLIDSIEYKNNLRQYAGRLKYLTYLYDNKPLPDSSNYKLWFSSKVLPDVMKFYRRKQNPHYKSETLSGVLSAIIPGLGKIYVGEIGDGITALLFNGVLGFLAYNNFKANHKFRAWLFTGLTAVFYGGNIYGSVAAAQIYNSGVNFRFTRELNLFSKKHNYFLPKFKFLCE